MNSIDSKIIPNQVTLPLSVAYGVVIQGLRIRLGRSIVTITGVTCGIAFLMSILTGQLVKQGVAEEDSIRAEVGRIESFMRTELPKLSGKTLAVVGGGNLSEIETRITEKLLSTFDAKALVFDSSFSPTPKRPLKNVVKGAVADADIIILMGDGKIPQLDFAGFVSKDLNNIVTSTILESEAAQLGVANARFVKLARTLTAEEQAKIMADKKKDRFRSIWVGVISLLVTVIGIANAMLMSVTERFREIGTMKCLGALSSFVTRMFVLESSLVGCVGGIGGAILGALFAIIIYTITYGAGLVFGSLPLSSVFLFGLLSVVAGIVLSVIAALYPARVAAAMVPATALRSNV